MSETKVSKFIYGIGSEEDLEFVPEKLAQQLGQLRLALRQASTWAEFKSLAPNKFFQDAWQLAQDAQYVDAFSLDDAFDPEHIPGFEDGDWPLWTKKEMLTWLPQEIQEKFGEVKMSVINGPYLSISHEKESEIVAALRTHGIFCTEDTDLIQLINDLA